MSMYDRSEWGWRRIGMVLAAAAVLGYGYYQFVEWLVPR